MINLNELEKYRVKTQQVINHFGSVGDDKVGCFLIPSPRSKKHKMFVMASSGEGWEHVSASCKNRVPDWYEMDHLAKMFFPKEVVVQYHVPVDQHVNNQPHTLHMWRPLEGDIITPPVVMV